jgi:hypothetical protein
MSESTIRSVDPTRSPLASLFVDICATYLDAPMFDWANGCVTIHWLSQSPLILGSRLFRIWRLA